MPKILFICSANQFRSPLCAALFIKKLQENGLLRDWTIESAGNWVKKKTRAHPAALKEAKKLGIDLGRHEAREVTRPMIESADLVIVMTRDQLEALHIEFADHKEKIVMLNGISNNLPMDISDPAEEQFINAEDAAKELQSEIHKIYPILVDKFSNKQT